MCEPVFPIGVCHETLYPSWLLSRFASSFHLTTFLSTEDDGDPVSGVSVVFRAKLMPREKCFLSIGFSHTFSGGTLKNGISSHGRRRRTAILDTGFLDLSTALAASLAGDLRIFLCLESVLHVSLPSNKYQSVLSCPFK